jgi:aspartate kinase
MEAERCEIYTDVDGIYTADPRIISTAKKLERIDFRDMLALSRSGSQVLHDKSVELALANNIDIQLLSSFDDKSGSVVCRLKDKERPDFAGVTRNIQKGEVSLAGKAADSAALSRMVILLAKEGIPVLSGRLDDCCATVAVEPVQLERAMQLVHDRIVLG